MAFVQANHAINDASGTALAVTLTGVVAGNTISGQFTYEDPSTSVLAVSDGTANVYTVADNLTALSFRSATFYCKTTVGGSLTITATPGGACTFRRIQVREDSGLGALDQHVINQSATFGTGADACTSTAKVTAVACTVLGYYYDNSAATIPSAGTGATLRDGFTNAAGDALAMDEKVQGGAGSVAATFTTTGGTDNIYVGMLAFQPAAVASRGFTKQPGPGVSPSKRDQFRGQTSAGPNPAIFVGLTGVVGTGAAGTLSPSTGVISLGALRQPGPGIGPFNNGQFVSSPRGLTTATAAALTGVSGTSAVGSVGAAISAPLTGNASTSAIGSVAAQIDKALTGNASTSAVGTLAASVVVPLTGVAGTGAVGTVIPGTDGTAAATGVVGTGAAGTLAAAVDTALTGNTSTSAVGSVAAAVDIALTGVGATGSVGTVGVFGAPVTVDLTGVQATGAVGSVGAPVNASAGGGGFLVDEYRSRLRRHAHEQEPVKPAPVDDPIPIAPTRTLVSKRGTRKARLEADEDAQIMKIIADLL